MYEELEMRLLAVVGGREEKCDGCPYEEDYPCCVDCLDKLHKQSADAIAQLNTRIDFLMNCIYEAEDALDRGADNYWARAALEKAERGQDDV